MKIIYTNFPTESQEIEIKELIAEFEKFIPHYLHSFLIICSEKASKTLADIDIKDEYGEATLRIYPKFWTIDLEARRETILHEICHLWFAPLTSLTDDIISSAFSDEVLILLLKQLTKATEKSTSELCYNLIKKS